MSGLWADRSVLRSLTGDRPTGQEIIVGEEPLMLTTFTHFMTVLTTGKLPNGKQSSIPSVTAEEMTLLTTRHLAPSNPNPQDGPPIPPGTALNRIMLVLSGMDNLFEFVFSAGTGGVTHDLHSMTNRLWHGLVPISDRRWSQMGLDKQEDMDKAAFHIKQALDFQYFNMSRKQRALRQRYNKVYDILEEFDRLVDDHHQTASPSGTRGGRTAHLWAEFLFSHVTFITCRVHNWATMRIDDLLSFVEEDMDAVRNSSRSTEAAITAAYAKYQRLYQTILGLQATVDLGILIPLVGCKNDLPHWRHLSSPLIVNWAAYRGSGPLTPHVYPAVYKERGSVYEKRLRYLLDTRTIQRVMGNPQPGAQSRLSAERENDRLAVYEEGRLELRGDPMKIDEELWISRLKGMMAAAPAAAEGAEVERADRWGFVAYRLCYEHSDEEWAAFLGVLDTDVTAWGDGVAGAADVEPTWEIRWIDGREHGIAEGDVDAARRHFKALRETDDSRRFQTVDAFIAIDKSSVESYLKSSTSGLFPPGDAGPFVVVAAGKHDQNEAARDATAPAFDGTVRVLGSVLVDDVFAQLHEHANRLQSLWRFAMVHPLLLYIGPCAQYQLNAWRPMNLMRAVVLGALWHWQRRPGART